MLVACESSNGWRPEAVTSGGVVAGGGAVQGVIVITPSKMQLRGSGQNSR